MIYKYSELKEYIVEDFVLYYKKKKFDELQIYWAILDDYKRGKDGTGLKEICIHIFLILNYKENNLNYTNVLENLKNKISLMSMEDIKSELKDEYDEFIEDYTYVIERV